MAKLVNRHELVALGPILLDLGPLSQGPLVGRRQCRTPLGRSVTTSKLWNRSKRAVFRWECHSATRASGSGARTRARAQNRGLYREGADNPSRSAWLFLNGNPPNANLWHTPGCQSSRSLQNR
jgi:hypothetical protein